MMRYSYEYPRPAVCVDVAVFVIRNSAPYLLLIKRLHEPFAGQWALPGGFIDESEDLVDAARRELREETSLMVNDLKQLGAYGKPGRDPRGHTISVVFVGEINTNSADRMLKAADDAEKAAFFPCDQLPDLAFDHQEIVADALRFFGQA